MEENKNINSENEPQAEEIKTENEAGIKEEKKTEKDTKKPQKQKPIRNQAFLKRGSYSLAITALVIAGIIVFNILVGALAKRFNLEFDMSSDKKSSISEENIDFIKSVDKEISVIVCANPENYVGGYMAYYAQSYGISEDAGDYYKQTIKLIDKYDDYNKKIKVEYVDTQSTEFTKIASEYSNTTVNYGDILVSADVNGAKRYKKIGFKDIYQITEDDQYAAYGYTVSNITGNNIETALTSAISYVISNEDKKIAVLTGHSANDYTEEYINLLKQNNYTVDVISDNVITSISKDYDAVVIAAPAKDFLREELVVLSEFLSNGKKLDKGLIYFADAASPYLPNFSDFLTEWGISIEEGILFETNDNYHIPDENTELFSLSTKNDDITSDVNFCVSGYNVPIAPLFDQKDNITVTSLVATSENVVAAPVGISNDWKGFDKYTPQSYSTVIQSQKLDYGDDNEEIKSYVMAFSSVEFLYSQYMEYSDVSNKNITFSVSERAANAEDGGITFLSKTITNESFADKVTETKAGIVRFIFVIALPLITIVAGIYIYIKRRNA